jgi:hypothetical protein
VADEQVVRLLEEIRDLQKEHIASYKEAVKNQQEAIALQKRVSRRGLIFMLFRHCCRGFGCVGIAISPSLGNFKLRHYQPPTLIAPDQWRLPGSFIGFHDRQ